METTNIGDTVFADLYSPVLEGNMSAILHGEKRCFSFWYHMHGAGIGKRNRPSVEWIKVNVFKTERVCSRSSLRSLARSLARSVFLSSLCFTFRRTETRCANFADDAEQLRVCGPAAL